jgi:hypothetical protein
MKASTLAMARLALEAALDGAVPDDRVPDGVADGPLGDRRAGLRAADLAGDGRGES